MLSFLYLAHKAGGDLHAAKLCLYLLQSFPLVSGTQK